MLEDGSVNCWGYNGDGQLGRDKASYLFAEEPLTPLPVNLGAAAKSIALGAYHSCAILEDGSVNCWGYNGDGQLGNGKQESSATPVLVDLSGAKATAMALGSFHSCALLEGGLIRCWGYGGMGQLGDGVESSSRKPVPVDLGGVKATAVALGAYHSCALLEGGIVKCWGSNSSSQIGAELIGRSATPVTIDLGGAVAIELAVGIDHSCALLSGGAVKCWGYGGYGQLGNGLKEDSLAPVSVALGVEAIGLALGFSHSCALLSGGAVKCWGSGLLHGQLGNGAKGDSFAPVTVELGAAQASVIVSGDSHSCALLEGSSMECWGHGGYGQLGNGLGIDSPTPVKVQGN